MLQVGRNADFAQETLGANQGSEFRLQHLECYPAVVTVIAREIDGRHPAGSDLALNGVAAKEAGVQLCNGVHCPGYYTASGTTASCRCRKITSRCSVPIRVSPATSRRARRSIEG